MFSLKSHLFFFFTLLTQGNKGWANPPETCDVYEGQKAGRYDQSEPYANAAGRTDVEGWWVFACISWTVGFMHLALATLILYGVHSNYLYHKTAAGGDVVWSKRVVSGESKFGSTVFQWFVVCLSRLTLACSLFHFLVTLGSWIGTLVPELRTMAGLPSTLRLISVRGFSWCVDVLMVYLLACIHVTCSHFFVDAVVSLHSS